AGDVVRRLAPRPEEEDLATRRALFRSGQPEVELRALPVIHDDARDLARRIVEDQWAGLLQIREGHHVGHFGIGSQDALARHVVVVEDPVSLTGLAVGDAGPVPTHDPDGRNRPLVELRGALEILNVQQLLDPLLRWQSSVEIDLSHARFDARW